MSTTQLTTATRRVPPFGGFSRTLLRLEFRRMARNRRTVLFTLVLPAVFFLLFGTGDDYRHESVGAGNVTAYIMISMAVYGAMIATTSCGAMVATERALGWSRQLRLTPLHPVAYVAVKVCVAMTTGLAAMAVVFLVGHFAGAEIGLGRLALAGLLGWLATVVFAAFGLFMGYLLPSENVMQLLGPALALLSFAGGLFVPVDQLGDTFATIAKLTPAYGVGVIARWPLTEDGGLGVAVLNLLGWLALFVAGAAWRMTRDTQRV